MIGIDDAVAAATSLLSKGIDKIWPDPAAKASADAVLLKATADAAIGQMAASMAVILADSQSADSWTSRARPSFLYVMYIMILVCIPFSLLWAFTPTFAANMAAGMQAWLKAIPDSLWALFGVGYTGYAINRTVEKVKGVN